MPIKSRIRTIPDHPKPGIQFRDITTLLQDPVGLRIAVEGLVEHFQGEKIDKVAGIEARGFIFGAPLADRFGCGFVPLRKPGKLPAATRRLEYQLEYGTDALEMHEDAFPARSRVLVVDDLLATGGTALAAAQLVELAGGTLVGLAFVVNLKFLPGEAKLAGYPTQFLVEYE